MNDTFDTQQQREIERLRTELAQAEREAAIGRTMTLLIRTMKPGDQIELGVNEAAAELLRSLGGTVKRTYYQNDPIMGDEYVITQVSYALAEVTLFAAAMTKPTEADRALAQAASVSARRIRRDGTTGTRIE